MFLYSVLPDTPADLFDSSVVLLSVMLWNASIVSLQPQEGELKGNPRLSSNAPRLDVVMLCATFYIVFFCFVLFLFTLAYLVSYILYRSN